MFDPDALRSLLNDDSTTLGRALALVSTVDPSAPEESEIESMLDELADGRRLTSPIDLFEHVYGTLRFTGDTKRYYSPDNSLLHRVLNRRKGNPLSLAVVASEIGRRHDLTVRPVGMPGHVLMTDTGDRWFDPFGAGVAMSHDDCRRLFNRYVPDQAFTPNLLTPMALDSVVTRTLANLFNAYVRIGDLGQVIRVTKFDLAIRPTPTNYAKLTRLLELAGRFEEAADVLEKASPYNDTTTSDLSITSTNPDEDGAEVAQTIQRLRAHRN